MKQTMKRILLVYSDFELLPVFYHFPIDSDFASLARRSDQFVVNLDEIADDVCDFICAISTDAYYKRAGTSDTNDLTEYRVDNPSGFYDEVVSCGFAP